jgi:hypothetical protein
MLVTEQVFPIVMNAGAPVTKRMNATCVMARVKLMRRKMILKTLSEIWHGFLTGLGVELSFFVLWISWTITHTKLIRDRVRPGHWIHKLAEYFE